MICESDFRPAFWLRGGHGQTIFAAKLRLRPELTVNPERLELDDGDFLDLSWLPEQGLPANAPVVIVLHGLNGGLDSNYARGLLRRIAAGGARGLLLHFRGADKPNRLPRSYHSGETGDLATVIAHVRSRWPRASIAAAGYSLGANVLLKYQGEQGDNTPLTSAVAVSVPFDLAKCAEAVNHGLSRIYRRHLLQGMGAAVRAKFRQIEPPFELPDPDTLVDFPSFDTAITAPLNGFVDAADYYRQSSCQPYLRHIRVPTLILQAADDPFMAPGIMPAAEALAPPVRLEWSRHGGHVGFVAAGRYGQPLYWLEQHIPDWYARHVPGFAALAEAAPAQEMP